MIIEFISKYISLLISYIPNSEMINNKYGISIGILLLFLLVAKVVQFISKKYLSNIALKTKTNLDELIISKIKNPLLLLFLFYGVKLSINYLGIDGIFTKLISSTIALLFLIIILRSIDIIIITWGDAFAKKTKTHIDEVLLPLFHKTNKVIIVFIAIMWILHVWGVNITPYLAGVGLSGLILGLALQDALKNVFGGIALILDKSFNIGDPIKLESGESGVVKEIGLRSTKILTYDNEILFVPNGQLSNMKIINFVKPNKRVRKIVNFSVEYGNDPEKVKKIVLNTLKEIKDIFDDPYMDVVFIEMGDSGLKFQARFWADWDNAYNKWVEATEKIYAALNKAKIRIPFPTRTIYLKK